MPSSSSEDNTICIRLTYTDPTNNKRNVHTLPHLPSNCTIYELKEICMEVFGQKQQKQQDISTRVSLYAGYPPKQLEQVDSAKIVECGIERNSNVMVKILVNGNSNNSKKKTSVAAAGKKNRGKQPAAIKPKKKSTTTTSSNTNSRKRSRLVPSDDEFQGEEDDDPVSSSVAKSVSRPRSARASAIAASSTFREVNAAMEQLEQETSSSNNTNGTKKKSNLNSSAVNKRKHTIPNNKNLGTGRVLSNGSIIPSNNTKKKRNKGGGVLTSQNDVASHLLSSLSSRGGNGKIGSALRTVMRGAVSKSYDKSRAVIRVNAIQSKKYTLLPKEEIDKNDADSDKNHVGVHTVQYDKGVDGRGQYTEDIDVISKEALEAVIRAVYADHDDGGDNHHNDDDDNPNPSGRDMLKPMYMANVSPRVFWSLAYHYPDVNCITDALRKLIPDLNWSFLITGRKKILSQKAKENLRQERNAKQQALGVGEVIDVDAAANNAAAALDAVQAVEQAMEKMHENDQMGMRERAAKAALDRLKPPSPPPSSSTLLPPQKEEEEVWKLCTPTEEDQDEIEECILEGNQTYNKDHDHTTTTIDINDIIKTLIRNQIRNWRELANANPIDIRKALLSPTTTPNNSAQSSDDYFTEERIETWIEAAQTRSIDEIMMDILNHEEPLFVILRDKANAGTPKDLSLWKCIPDMLLEQIKQNGDDDDDVVKEVKVEDVGIWCKRSQMVLDMFDWLTWYATPVE